MKLIIIISLMLGSYGVQSQAFYRPKYKKLVKKEKKKTPDKINHLNKIAGYIPKKKK